MVLNVSFFHHIGPHGGSSSHFVKFDPSGPAIDNY